MLICFLSLCICSTEILWIATGNLVYKHGLPWLPSLQEIVSHFPAEGLNSKYALIAPSVGGRGSMKYFTDVLDELFICL